MKTRFSDIIEQTPSDSLLVGVLTTSDQDGNNHTNTIVEGSPEGFRLLARFLTVMADSVDSKDSDLGWGLTLSPEDIPALRTHDVECLSLLCKPNGN